MVADMLYYEFMRGTFFAACMQKDGTNSPTATKYLVTATCMALCTK